MSRSEPNLTNQHPSSVHIQRISVVYEYAVSFTRRLFSAGNPLFVETVSRHEPDRCHRLAFFIDEGVISGHPGLTRQIDGYLAQQRERLTRLGNWNVIPGGEACKDAALAASVQAELVRLAIDRQSFVIAIGGGAFLDLVGFAAATVHRGVRLIRIPSTVLAQNDAGVGVKNGFNAYGVKNVIGSFAPPFAVINDLDLLQSLHPRDRRAGHAEAVKVSLIRDRAFFDWLEHNANALRSFEPAATEYAIRRCAELHLEHTAGSGDPFETGSARPLDFGHWAAHRLENLSDYALRHGEAVAIGIALDVRYSCAAGYLDGTTADRITELLEQLGFSLWYPALDQRDAHDRNPLFLDGLDEFREHLGGELTIPMLKDIGSSFDINEMDISLVLSARDWLKARAASRS